MSLIYMVAGVCSRCGGSSGGMQIITMYVNSSGEVEALCAACMAKDIETRMPDWFAAEERVTR